MTAGVAGSPPSGPVEALFLDGYERGEPALATGAPPSPIALHNLQLVLTRAAPAWVAAHGSADAPRRRLAVATYVLDVLQTESSDALLWKTGQPAADLLEWASEFVRKEPLRQVDGGHARPPLEAERSWFVASLALIERVGAANDGMLSLRPDSPRGRELIDRHIDHAAERFPDESRWALGRALALELHTWPEPRDERPFDVQPRLNAALLAEYATASAVEGVRQEALVRWGAFELRRGSPARALEHLDQVGRPDDVYVRYWLHLLRGRALEDANRLAEAIASYRLALADAPFAQSATMALGAALMSDHRTAEASALVTGALQAGPHTDPWFLYVFPDWRFLPAAMADLKQAVLR